MTTPRVTDRADGTRWVTLTRPEVANALRLEDLPVIAKAFHDVDRVRAVVITGSGVRVFCAGMHTETFVGLDPTSAREAIGMVRDTLTAVRTCPVPTIAMINGACLGAAFELILGCDARVAHPQVRFGLPEVKLGIPSVIDAALVHRYLGLSKAKELVLTGDQYTLDELGGAHLLVNRVAEPDRLAAEVDDLVARLAAPTREVTAAQKGLFETWLNTGLEQSIATSVEVFGDMFRHPATADAIDEYRRRSTPRNLY